MLECNLGTKGLYNSLYNILLHGVTLPSLDSASLSVTELVEYCFRASHPPSEVVVYFLLGKICLSTPEGYIPTFPRSLPKPFKFICITVSILQSSSFSLESRINLAEISLLFQHVWLFLWGDLLSLWESSTWLMQQREWGKKAILSQLCPLTKHTIPTHHSADWCCISFIYLLITAT